jgi:cullin 3
VRSTRPPLTQPTHILPFTASITQGPRLVVPLLFPFLSSSIQHGPNIAVDESWAKLTLNIREIQHHNAHKLSFEECYRLSYQLVVSKHGQMLYNGVRDLVIENLNRLAEETILPAFPSGLEQDPMQQSREGERLLKAVHKVWSDHTDCMDKLSHILKYMVRPTTRVIATNIRPYVLRTAYM